MNSELIIPYQKIINKNRLAVLLAFLAYTVFVYRNIDWYVFLDAIFSCYAYALFVIGFVFLLIGLVHYLYLQSCGDPAAVLNQEGIWIKYYGFIPWDNIEAINLYTLPLTPLEAVGIRIKDVDLVYKYATFAGKMSLFWAKKFRYYYHISIMNTEVGGYQMVIFARKFLNI